MKLAGPSVLGAALPRLQPHLLAARRPAVPRTCTDEARAKQKYWDAQFMWVIDARKEDKLVPVATFMPDREKYFNRPGRYGAHNILEHLPADGPVEGHRVPDLLQRGLACRERQRSVPSEGDRLLRAGAGGRPPGGAIQRHRHRRARPALSDRPRRGAGMHILEYTG